MCVRYTRPIPRKPFSQRVRADLIFRERLRGEEAFDTVQWQMPAYRVPLPQQVYKCLLKHPDGCPYDEMARFFQRQAADKKVSSDINTVWPQYCQTTKQWQSLAPPVYQHSDQINEPLGDERADQLAQALGIKPKVQP